ncbi:MAG: hypothetical protein ACRDHD_11680, partial [Candidatus Limnocylindria bacterium]
MDGATALPAERAPAARELPRVVPVLAAGAGIGLLVQLLFFDVGLGINFPIAIGAILAAGWLAPARAPRRPRAADLWLPVAALVLAAFVALRGDTTLLVLDGLGSLALTGAALASFGGLRVVERPLGGLILLGGRVAAAAAGAAAEALAAGWHAVRADRI